MRSLGIGMRGVVMQDTLDGWYEIGSAADGEGRMASG
jgi:hypothetical protein